MKRETLKEAILLEEPIDELPSVKLDAPITIEEPQVDETIKENAMASIISNEISSTYMSIDSIKSAIATISSEMPEREDIIAILNQIIDDKTISIGMLQKAVDLIDGKSENLIDNGNEAAEIISHEGEPKEGEE